MRQNVGCSPVNEKGDSQCFLTIALYTLIFSHPYFTFELNPPFKPLYLINSESIEPIAALATYEVLVDVG